MAGTILSWEGERVWQVVKAIDKRLRGYSRVSDPVLECILSGQASDEGPLQAQ